MTTPSPRLRSRLPFLLVILGAAVVAGCGGTNSETPWPVEPDDVDLGPEGESRGNAELGAPAPSSAKPASSTAPASPQEGGGAVPPQPPSGGAPSTPSTPATQF